MLDCLKISCGIFVYDILIMDTCGKDIMYFCLAGSVNTISHMQDRVLAGLVPFQEQRHQHSFGIGVL